LTTLDTLLEEIRTGPSGPRIAAFFDFDGTLIDGYSAAALYSHRLRNFEIGPAEAAHTVLAGLRGPLTEDQFAQLVERASGGGRAGPTMTWPSWENGCSSRALPARCSTTRGG